MRRSQRTLLFVLAMASIALFALPATASAQNSLNCEDFSSQSEAQDELDSGFGDSNILDRDDDGSACEDFDFGDGFENADFEDASTDAYPTRGIASGGGSMAAGGMSPLPLVLSGAAFALLAGGSWALGLRRRLRR